MTKKKTSKHDECVEKVKEIAVYVDSNTKTVGIFCVLEDMITAEKNIYLKKLKNLYKYSVQMVIK